MHVSVRSKWKKNGRCEEMVDSLLLLCVCVYVCVFFNDVVLSLVRGLLDGKDRKDILLLLFSSH